MGYNTGVILLNDHIDAIWENPDKFAEDFKQGFYDASRNVTTLRQDTISFSLGACANGGSIFHLAHADAVGVYAIGGNHTSKMFSVYNGGRHYRDEDRLRLLKGLAEEMGYRISKITKKK